MTFSSIHHSFDIQLAAVYGVHEAILIHHFQHWIRINKCKGNNQRDDRTWTYQTRDDIAALFPYFTYDQVRRLTDKLVESGILRKGNYNKSVWDKTIWYAFENEDIFIIGNFAKSTDESAKSTDESARPIPDTKTTDTKTYPSDISKEDISSGSSERSRPHASKVSGIVFSKEEFNFKGILEEDRESWKVAYPGVDLDKELARMVEWIKSNPTKSNKRHWRKFITTWLGKSSDTIAQQEARKGASESFSETDQNAKINTTKFYELQKKYPGSFKHCYVKNGYLINKTNSKEVRIDMKPECFEDILCSVAGVRRHV